MRRSRPKQTRVANHAKPSGPPTAAATAARRGGFFSGGAWSADVLVQFLSRITLKGGDVEVREGEENLKEVDVDIEGTDANVESEEEAEKADKTDDNW